MSSLRPCSPCASQGYNDLYAADQVHVRQHGLRAQRQASSSQLAVGHGPWTRTAWTRNPSGTSSVVCSGTTEPFSTESVGQ